MPSREIIFAGSSPFEPVAWYRRSETGAEKSGHEASFPLYIETAHTPSDAETIIVLPGEQVVMREVTSPAKSSVQRLQAARFILEDDIAGDVTALHLALFKTQQKSFIIGLDRDIMQQWVTICSERDFMPDIITADFLCLFWGCTENSCARIVSAPGGVTPDLARKQARRTARLSIAHPQGGFTLAQDLLTFIAPDSWRQFNIEAVDYFGPSESRDLDQLFADTPVQFKKTEQGIETYALFHEFVESSAPPNFLQGDFARNVDWVNILKPWRLAAILLSGVFLVYLASVLIEGWQDNFRAGRIYLEATQRFQNAYPDITIRNLEVQARNRGRDGTAQQADFVSLISILTEEIEQQQNTLVTNLRYGATGILSVDVLFPDTQELDVLKSSLSDRGVEVEEGARLTPVEDKFLGQLSLRLQS